MTKILENCEQNKLFEMFIVEKWTEISNFDVCNTEILFLFVFSLSSRILVNIFKSVKYSRETIRSAEIEKEHFTHRHTFATLTELGIFYTYK